MKSLQYVTEWQTHCLSIISSPKYTSAKNRVQIVSLIIFLMSQEFVLVAFVSSNDPGIIFQAMGACCTKGDDIM